MRQHFNSVFDLQINNSETFFLDFVISGKTTSLPKVIKYVKRSKYSFHDFSSKHTPIATLSITCRNIPLKVCIKHISFIFGNNIIDVNLSGEKNAVFSRAYCLLALGY